MMPMTYLDRYQQQFSLVRFNKLPEHMMYFVHSGVPQSTDIDYTKYHKTLSERFLFDKPVQLRHLSVAELKQTIDQLHQEFVPGISESYRDRCIIVPLMGAIRDPYEALAYIKQQYANQREKVKLFQRWQLGAKENINRIHIEIAQRQNSRLRTIDECDQYIKTAHNAAELIAEIYERRSREVDTGFLVNRPKHELDTLLEMLSNFTFNGVIPSEIEAQMQTFYQQLHLKLHHDDPIKTAAWVCMEYTRIHPRENGSGRMSRTIANIILMQAGVMPFIVENDDEYMLLIQRKGLTVDDFADYILRLSGRIAHNYFNNLPQYLWEFPPQDKNTMELWGLVGKIGQMRLGGNPRNERKDIDMRQYMRTPSPQVPDLRQMYQVAAQYTRDGLKYSCEGNHVKAYQARKFALDEYIRIPACDANVLAKCYFNLAFSAEKCGKTAEAQEFGRLAAELAINNRAFTEEFKANCKFIREYEVFNAHSDLSNNAVSNNTR